MKEIMGGSDVVCIKLNEINDLIYVDLNDCDWELSPLLWNENRPQVLN